MLEIQNNELKKAKSLSRTTSLHFLYYIVIFRLMCLSKVIWDQCIVITYSDHHITINLISIFISNHSLGWCCCTWGGQSDGWPGPTTKKGLHQKLLNKWTFGRDGVALWRATLPTIYIRSFSHLKKKIMQLEMYSSCDAYFRKRQSLELAASFY